MRRKQLTNNHLYRRKGPSRTQTYVIPSPCATVIGRHFGMTMDDTAILRDQHTAPGWKDDPARFAGAHWLWGTFGPGEGGGGCKLHALRLQPPSSAQTIGCHNNSVMIRGGLQPLALTTPLKNRKKTTICYTQIPRANGGLHGSANTCASRAGGKGRTRSWPAF